MQQDNTIVNKLQQLENQQLPDLSHMDAHWAAMEAMLPNAHPPARKPLRWWWLVAACLCCGTLFLLLRKGDPADTVQHSLASAAVPQQASTPQPVGDSSPVARFVVSGDTLKLIRFPPVAARKKTARRSSGTGNNTDVTNRRVDTVYFNLNYIDCKDKAATGNTDSQSNGMLRKEKRLALMAQLEKSPDGYIIDNRQDTQLLCREGTLLGIPAGSLGRSAAVQLLVKEYYKKSEFVADQLTATSDKDLLESGGMLHITALVNGNPVTIVPGFSIRVYMATEAGKMTGMQLFTGERITRQVASPVVRFDDELRDITNGPSSTYVNWTAQGRPFTGMSVRTEVRVLDLVDEPARVKEKAKGKVGIFYRAPGATLSRAALRAELQTRYDYYKVRVKQWRRRGLFGKIRTDGVMAGDSAWLDKATADRYKLPYTQIRLLPGERGVAYPESFFSNTVRQNLQQRLGVDIRALGWINCDRFYNSTSEKVTYVVNLGDQASGYATVLVFDNLNAVMNGYVSGKEVFFQQVPAGEPVTVVSIGVTAAGKTVYGIKKVVIAKEGLQEIGFTQAPAGDIKSALQKLDQ